MPILASWKHGLVSWSERAPEWPWNVVKPIARAESMALIVKVKPEVQAELSRQASAQGDDIGKYAEVCWKMR